MYNYTSVTTWSNPRLAIVKLIFFITKKCKDWLIGVPGYREISTMVQYGNLVSTSALQTLANKDPDTAQRYSIE